MCATIRIRWIVATVAIGVAFVSAPRPSASSGFQIDQGGRGVATGFTPEADGGEIGIGLAARVHERAGEACRGGWFR